MSKAMFFFQQRALQKLPNCTYTLQTAHTTNSTWQVDLSMVSVELLPASSLQLTHRKAACQQQSPARLQLKSVDHHSQ